MKIKLPFLAPAFALFISATLFAAPPNIVYILCDDLGYGDIQCLNLERGKIATPHVDRLAKEGMTFTDAHSGSSVCTPTRYGLLTGRYAWRTTLQGGVITGNHTPLIAPERLTVGKLLQQQGYHTGIVGKWHLGFNYEPFTPAHSNGKKLLGGAEPGAQVPNGPLTRGFDYYYGFHHAREMGTVIENDRVLEDTDLLYTGVRELPHEFWDTHGKGMESWQEAGQNYYRISGPLCGAFLRNEFVFQPDDKAFQATVIESTGASTVLGPHFGADALTRQDEPWPISISKHWKQSAANCGRPAA